MDDLEADPRVRVLNKPNGGDHTARNFAIRDAEGKYVAMLDADNAFEPEFVERAVAMLEADPALAYVTCRLRLHQRSRGGWDIDAGPAPAALIVNLPTSCLPR